MAPRLRRVPSSTLSALAFFSRLPLPAPTGPFDLREAAGAWPLAGALLALGPGLAIFAGDALELPILATALLALGVAWALGGGLHEDGLADTADGLGGGHTREAKLAIMRDSRLGTHGALALILATGLKTAALASLAVEPGRALGILAAVGALSRACAVAHWACSRPARADGLAASAGQPDGVSIVFAAGSAVVAIAGLAALVGSSAVVGVAGAVSTTALLHRLCRRHIGGHTGDTIGGCQQVAEVALLVGCASLRPSLIMVG